MQILKIEKCKISCDNQLPGIFEIKILTVYCRDNNVNFKIKK